jgi:ribosomal protein S18 acetylase RimI-like enzyme
MHDAIRREARGTSGVCGIRLYVEGDNQTAQHAYRRAGMRMSSYQVYEEEFILPPQERKEPT